MGRGGGKREARLSNIFFTKNLNLKKKKFGRGSLGRGLALKFYLLRIQIGNKKKCCFLRVGRGRGMVGGVGVGAGVSEIFLL